MQWVNILNESCHRYISAYLHLITLNVQAWSIYKRKWPTFTRDVLKAGVKAVAKDQISRVVWLFHLPTFIHLIPNASISGDRDLVLWRQEINPLSIGYSRGWSWWNLALEKNMSSLSLCANFTQYWKTLYAELVWVCKKWSICQYLVH